jgi:predicted DNA-binding transcriptional regulator AlpA
MSRLPGQNERRLSAIRPIPRRGLSREEAAIYIGIGVTKFDAMVAEGKMPQPKRIDGRRVWDKNAPDFAFDQLPTENGSVDSTWDDVDGAKASTVR